ncbi:MAG TPA: hypothetical protein VGF17_25580, partial [Phytomonospora sp.]
MPPYPPGPPAPRKSRAGLWIGLAAAFVVLALGVVVGLSVTGVIGPGDDSPAVAVDQEHVYDPDVCRRIKLVVFDYFGEPDG